MLDRVLTVRMNDAAARSLGPDFPLGEAPPAEAPRLHELLAEGVVRRDEVIVLARHRDQAGGAPGGFGDLTGWECGTNSFHLDDVIPVERRFRADGEPVIGEADQTLLLRHGLWFAVRVAHLAAALEDPVPVCCIVGTNSTGGTFRLHRARPGQSWLAADLDGYATEKIIAVDFSPAEHHPA